ncbi:MAG: tRNA (adenosine(37)-N6)-threonylcarbamoyltransferase complex transferase subunit TsaD [Chloroflexi bacterium]|nr:tRNA (adenosine(37)-N6)-threonylcarbamoyltransferase complex transferase subunit TsaD [Chloroflexota bacterium]
MRVLGIETSCDETAAAVVEDGRKIFSSVVASQVDLHAQFGGVFPEAASRQHILNIYPIIEAALREAHMDLKEVDAVAVTRGPGLPGSLVVGINAAKGLSLGSGLPILGINHLEGHLYSAWLHEFSGDLPPEPRCPLMALIVSGGHTELILMEDHCRYRRLGGTLDDAAGEAFDKIARLIGLSYPGGPAIQRAAEEGNPQAVKFPRPWLPGSWDFSFSGLKTAVLRTVRALEADTNVEGLPVADLAASFQASVVEVLVGKTLEAAREFDAKEILVVGGVSANKALRERFWAESRLPVHIPPLSLCTDNAAMIAGAGCYRFGAGQRDGLDMDALPTWPLSELSI